MPVISGPNIGDGAVRVRTRRNPNTFHHDIIMTFQPFTLSLITFTDAGADEIARAAVLQAKQLLLSIPEASPRDYVLSFMLTKVSGPVDWEGDMENPARNMNLTMPEVTLYPARATRSIVPTWDNRGLTVENVKEAIKSWMNTAFDHYKGAVIDMRGLTAHVIARRNAGFTSKKVDKLYRCPQGVLPLRSHEAPQGYCFFKALNEAWKSANPKEPPLMTKGLNLRTWRAKLIPDEYDQSQGITQEHAERITRSMGIPVIFYFEDLTMKRIQPNAMDTRKPAEIFLHDAHWWQVRRGGAEVRKRKGAQSPLNYGEDMEEICIKKQRPRTPKCLDCNRAEKEGHVCNPVMKRRYQANQAKRVENERVTCNTRFYKEKPNPSIVFFDFETGPLETNTHQVYAVGYKRIESDLDPVTTWGKDSLKQFIEQEIQHSEGKPPIFCSFGGSFFDNTFILKWWMVNEKQHFDNKQWEDEKERGRMAPEIIMKNGRIVSMSLPFKRASDEMAKFKFWDLACFLTGSLDGNCKSFGVDSVAKGTFPHKWMDAWEKLEDPRVPSAEYWPKKKVPDHLKDTSEWNLKEESLKYLRSDVLCLEELFKRFEQAVFDACHVSVTEFMTVSQMAWNLAMSCITPNRNKESEDFDGKNPITGDSEPTIHNHVNIPLLKQEYLDATLQSIYGGRVWVGQHAFISEFADEIGAETTTKERRKELYKRLKAGEHLEYWDVNGLYAFCLQKEFPCGPVRELTGDELEHLEREAAEGLRLPNGIYHVRVEPSKHYRCRLPRKVFKIDNRGLPVPTTGLLWDMTEDFEGYYNHRDLNIALRAGYKIQFYSGITWEREMPILKKFIEMTFAIKMRGEREGNPAMRALGKLLANATYGKSFEKPSLGELQMFSTEDEFLDWATHTEIFSMIQPSDNCFIAVGENMKVERKLHRRPVQIGSNVLSHSREHIFKLEDIVHNETGKVAVYGDTDSLIYQASGEDITTALKDYMKPGVLGDLANDIKGDGNFLGFFGIFVCPKTYMIRALDANGDIKTVMKAKGLPTRLVKEEMYEKILEAGYDDVLSLECIDKVHFETLKRYTSLKDTRMQQKFSTIETSSIERSFAKEFCWNNRYTTPFEPGLPFWKEE